MRAEDIIIRKIREKGPISFRNYMEMALYTPGAGYYQSAEHKTGRKGDFFTSPYISSGFGAMLGKQIEEIYHLTGGPFTIVELGAGNGMLCRDIMKYLRENASIYKDVHYVMVEKSPFMRNLSKPWLPERVALVEDILQVSAFQGCLLSNEFFDNLPFFRIEMHEEPMEIYVDYQNGFRETLRPPGKEIRQLLRHLRLPLPTGSKIEISDTADWFKHFSEVLQRGYMITIDYGYQSQELHLNNPGGTLRCYYRHHVNQEPYFRPGSQDITADVNFSVLDYWGSAHGFSYVGFINQANFLRSLGFPAFLEKMKDTEENKHFALKMLMHEMGGKFKVLVQSKNVAPALLTGLTLQKPSDKYRFTEPA